jgi:hypothetical protein
MALALVFCNQGFSQEANGDAPLVELLTQSAAQFAPKANITVDGGIIKIGYAIREYSEYSLLLNGKWADKPVVRSGPDADGFLVLVGVIEGEENGPLFRSPSLSLSLKTARRLPYYLVVNRIIRWNGRHAIIDVSFGEHADAKILTSLFDDIVSRLIQKFGKPIPAGKE